MTKNLLQIKKAISSNTSPLWEEFSVQKMGIFGSFVRNEEKIDAVIRNLERIIKRLWMRNEGEFSLADSKKVNFNFPPTLDSHSKNL